MTSKIILDERMLVSKDLITPSQVKQRYQIELFNEKNCARCDNLEERLVNGPNDLCKACPNLLAAYRLHKEVGNYYSVPQGDSHALQRLLDRRDIDYKVVDKRTEVPFQADIRFTGKLFGEGFVDENGIPRVNQKKLLKKWFEKKSGLLQAKPRSGKTVMACFACCRLRQRTVIMADRKELLTQFYKAFMGDPVKNRPAMTNIPDLRIETGKEIIRIAQKPSDLKNLDDVDILLINYQKLVRDPKRMAELVNGNFSFLIVDEVHGSGATGYLRVISQCSVKHRMGLTATPNRKDNRHKLINRVMGQVVAKSASASLIPTITVKQSVVHPPRVYRSWHHAMGWLCSSKALRVELLKEVFKDLRDGHEVIILPLDRKKHINQIVAMINHQAALNNAKRGEKWPEKLAIPYYDGVNRQDVLDEVDKPGCTVLVANRQMIKQGIDFNRPSMIYVYIPMSASEDRETGAPMMEQLSNRVATPYKKPTPTAKIWVHNFSWFQSCIVGLFWNEIWPKRWNENNRTGTYKVEPRLLEVFKSLKKPTSKPKNNSKAMTWVG